MPYSSEYAQRFTRRAFLLGTGKAILMCGLAGRMYQLQILDSQKYVTLSDGNRIAFRLTPGPRGRLLDRWGQPLVVNNNTFQAVLLAEKVVDLEEAIQRLSQFIDLSEIDLDRLIEHLRGKSSSLVPLLIKDHLTWQEVSKLEVHRLELPGIAVDVGQQRFYPFGPDMAHFLGYVGLPTKEEQQEQKLPPIPGFYLGKSGIEKVLNLDLKGIEGMRPLEIDARRHVVRELEARPAKPGADYRLSLDHQLQLYAGERIAAYESGAVVVLDARTGDILALVSHPSFDPNLFVNGIRQKPWQEILENPYNPLLNKAVSGLYPPGSSIKMLVALAALSTGIITPSTKFSCTGYVTLFGHRFHCHTGRFGHGALNLQEAIMCSCDVFFYEMSRRVGVNHMIPFFEAFGLGQLLAQGFPGEKAGLVPSPAWKKEKKNKNWLISDTILTSIGQGYFLATPLQLAVMTARLATGQAICPSYLATETAEAAFPSLSVDPKHLHFIQESMYRVVNDARGTGRQARIPYAGAEIAGKTGTCQVRRITLRERELGKKKNHEHAWKERDHALFCGYAPFNHPRYSIAVLVEHGGSGSAVAAPLARDILWKAQRLEKERGALT